MIDFTYKHASLFSGIGGFDLAAQWMGWQNVFHCEINDFCSKILKYHFPNSKHYADITKTDFSEWRGKIDILTGGFPCQPFSVAGKRKGADDDRYLWPEMLRVIREVRPNWIICENVGGIVTMVQPGNEIEMESQATLFEKNNKETLLEQEYVIETVCRSLECEGYSVQPFIIPAGGVGAPHRRDRVWFVANSNSFTERSPGKSIELDKIRSKNINEQKGRGTEPKQYIRRCNVLCSSSNTDYERLQRRKKERDTNISRERKDKQPSRLFCSDWENFPTQSPVCSGDDGFSTRMDSITFSKWRSESVKAYGNAIVPQVAYEIFKAIQIVENEQKKD